MTYKNPWGWPLPTTDKILDDAPYAPLGDPAQNLAERLVWLGHSAFNPDVWGPATGRADKYWTVYGHRIVGSATRPTVTQWWQRLMETLPGVPLNTGGRLHEKNLICHPLTLAPHPVPDEDVLLVLRTEYVDLVDRVRMAVRVRRDTQTAARKGVAL